MTLSAWLSQCEVRAGASTSDLSEAERLLGHELPTDYKQLLLETDGLCGGVGDTGYLVLWPVTELAELTERFEVGKFLPGITLLGSDGGDTGYGFRTESGTLEYVALSLSTLDEDEVRVLGATLEEFLEALATED